MINLKITFGGLEEKDIKSELLKELKRFLSDRGSEVTFAHFNEKDQMLYAVQDRILISHLDKSLNFFWEDTGNLHSIPIEEHKPVADCLLEAMRREIEKRGPWITMWQFRNFQQITFSLVQISLTMATIIWLFYKRGYLSWLFD